jgi:uncharacterized protein YqgV (UPF0045/DUF77 family)
MIVQFSINPMDSEHMSADMERIVNYLDSVGVEYFVGPIGTSIQGKWNDIMPVIQHCHSLVAESHARVFTTITIDDHKEEELGLKESIEAGFDSGKPASTGSMEKAG